MMNVSKLTSGKHMISKCVLSSDNMNEIKPYCEKMILAMSTINANKFLNSTIFFYIFRIYF